MDKCVIIGGGTFSKVACHLSLATPAFGSTAKQLKALFDAKDANGFETILTLTKMADSSSDIMTNDDVEDYVEELIADKSVKAIIMNAALCDFSMENPTRMERLSSSDDYDVILTGIRTKIVPRIKQHRPDIITVGFKTTCNDHRLEQVSKGFDLLLYGRLDYVIANDVGTYNNILLSKDLQILEASRPVVLSQLTAWVTRDIGEAQCYQFV